jgi:hypothetical protein
MCPYKHFKLKKGEKMENSFNIVAELPYVLSADADKDKRNLLRKFNDEKILTR